METTTIKLSKKNKSRLDNLKSYKRETYEDIIEKMLSIFNLCRTNPEEARKKLLIIESQKNR